MRELIKSSAWLLPDKCLNKKWKWYNKLGTKIRAVEPFMKRVVYDNQFKIAAVKLIKSEDYFVTKAATELTVAGVVRR